MARRWLGSIATLLAGASLAWGQAATPIPQPPPLPQPVQAPPPSAIQQVGATATQLPVPPGPTGTQLPQPTLLNTIPAPGTTAVPPANPNCSECSIFLTKPYADTSRVWFQPEYLLWWIRPAALPPVIGTAPTKQVASGTLPSDSITTLVGGDGYNLDYNQQSGLRLSLGYWFNSAQDWGVDGNFFQLEQKTVRSTLTSSGSPVIGPLFYDPNTNSGNLILASLPNFATGPLAGMPSSATISTDENNRLWGAEINIRKQIGAVFFADHLDLLMGFRTLQFSEGFDIVTDSTSAPGSLTPGSLHIEDHFGTLNQFCGAQIGLASHTQVGRWSFDAIGKLALGDMHEVTNVNGSTMLTTATGTIASNTGILAEPTNIGRPTHDCTTVIPELTLNVGYQVLDNVRLTLGYNFLYVSNVLRAGDLIDGVDARQVRSLTTYNPMAQAIYPTPLDNESRFWAQGLNIGVEFRY